MSHSGTSHYVAAGRTLDVGGKTPPVQQQDHLAARPPSAADTAACNCRLMAPCDIPPRACWARRSMVPTAGKGRPNTRRGISHQRILASLCPLPALQRRRGRAEHQRNRFGRRPGHGDVAGVVSRHALLLERSLVLLVQDDQPQMRRGGENRAAGAHHHRYRALGNLPPMPVPLGVAKMAVQHGHRPESAGETARPSAASG